MTEKTILAIDPGANGGIALRSPESTDCYPMPKTQGDILNALREIRAESNNIVCYLEHVSGYAGKAQPGSAMFRFGEHFGFIEGVLQAYGIRTILVRPQKWQKHFSLGTASACASKTQWKNKLKAEAQRRFPHLTVTLKTADALLILDYAIAEEGNA